MAPGSAWGGFSIKVIPLPPRVEGSLPALEGEMLADAAESKDSHDFFPLPPRLETWRTLALFCLSLFNEQRERLILI